MMLENSLPVLSEWSREDYLDRYAKETDLLVKQRWILPEDRKALLERAERQWNEAAK